MRVIDTSLDENLAPVSGYLWAQGIRHRVFEERGRQILEVSDPRHAEQVQDLYAAWRDGRINLMRVDAHQPVGKSSALRMLAGQLLRYPALSALILLACAVFPFSLALGEGRLGTVAAALLIIDPASVRNAMPGLAELFSQLQVWRWLTPILLHFSIMHLAFNCAVVIELGRRIEAGGGSTGFVLLVALTGVASNLVQFTFGGSLLFGGLSGVAYGLLGFILVMNRRQPALAVWQLPRGIAIGLMVFLVLFTTGVTEAFGLHVANAAHWSGLAAGALAGLIWRVGRADPV
jgi:GlpG protein